MWSTLYSIPVLLLLLHQAQAEPNQPYDYWRPTVQRNQYRANPTEFVAEARRLQSNDNENSLYNEPEYGQQHSYHEYNDYTDEAVEHNDRLSNQIATGFHNFHNPYGALNIDRQLFGIPVLQLAAIFFAAVAFGGVAAQNGVGDIISDIIDPTTTTTTEATAVAAVAQDPCANVECEGDSNRCVSGKCVCGSTNAVCPETTPICFGDGEAAKCSCHAGSCAEPNPVCTLDGTCKCNLGKDACVAGQSDKCSTTDGAGDCKCGDVDQCSGSTPKCNTENTPATCVACDSDFCSQPLPYCVPTGETGAGSCQCGGASDCGTTDQTGNLCTTSDASGVCMCGESALCTSGSTVATCLNNASPPVFEAGDSTSTCKCSGTSCTTAGTGMVTSNGACSAETDATLGSCVSCKVEGKTGDGNEQGTCSADTKCHVDGSCSVCSSTAKGDATPQSGCDELNPTCKDDKSACVCKVAADPDPELICEKGTASACTSEECKCGDDPACSADKPICEKSDDKYACAKCNVDGSDGDGTKQGTCPDNMKCHSDGSCSVCSDVSGAGTMGDAHSGCDDLNPSCDTTADKCQCAAELVCNSVTATVCDSTCKCAATDCSDATIDPPTPICDQTTDPTTPTCAKCSVSGSDGDGTAQGNCPSETDKCHMNGACAVCIDSSGAGTADDPHSGCSADSTKPKCDTGADPVECVAAD